MSILSDEEIIEAYVDAGVLDGIIAHNYLPEGRVIRQAQHAKDKAGYEQKVREILKVIDDYLQEEPWMTDEDWQLLKVEALRKKGGKMDKKEWLKACCPICGEEYPYRSDFKPATCSKFNCIHEFHKIKRVIDRVKGGSK